MTKTLSLRKILAINIRFYRYEKYQLSLSKFCEKFGLNEKYISEVERAKRNISIDMIDKISRKIEVPAQTLLTYDPNHRIKKTRIDQKNNIK